VLAVDFGNNYVGSSPTIGIFLYVAQAVESVLAVDFGNNYVGSSPTISIFLYVAQTVQRMLAVDFGNNYVGSSPTIGIFLYVARPVEPVLATAFGNKLCWVESHYPHISLCSSGISTRVITSLRKQSILVRVQLSAYFFMYPYK